MVSKGKETLERAIKLIESRSEWRARVVYGDTDSIFILLPGRSKSEAFRIGAEMADAVTASNPKPVKLKFEKVLYPSILQVIQHKCKINNLLCIFSMTAGVSESRAVSLFKEFYTCFYYALPFRRRNGTVVTCTRMLTRKSRSI